MSTVTLIPWIGFQRMSVSATLQLMVSQSASKSTLALSNSGTHDQILVMVKTIAFFVCHVASSLLRAWVCHVTSHSLCLCHAIHSSVHFNFLQTLF